MSTISVIIPSWNRADLLVRALDSVVAQTRQADEIIVVDDGSTDNTAAMLTRDYPQVRLLQQTHQGVSAARNRGIQHANSDWLALLDSDDAWHATKLEKQYQHLQAHSEYRIMHTDEQWLRNGKPLKQSRKHQKSGGWIFQRCLPLCVISPSAVLIHRTVFQELGLFDQTLIVCEDYDMWLRICAQMPVLYLDEALTIKYGGHADQLSRQYTGMDKYRIMALAKILHSKVLQAEAKIAATTELHKKIGIYLSGAKKHNNKEYVCACEQLLLDFPL